MGIISSFRSRSWDGLEAIATAATFRRDEASLATPLESVPMEPFMELPATLDELFLTDRVATGIDPVAVYHVRGRLGDANIETPVRELSRSLPMYLQPHTGELRTYSGLDAARVAATQLSRKLTSEWEHTTRSSRDAGISGKSVTTAVVALDLVDETRFGVAALSLGTPRGRIHIPAESPFDPFTGRKNSRPDSLVAQIDPIDHHLRAVHGARSGVETGINKRVVLMQSM